MSEIKNNEVNSTKETTVAEIRAMEAEIVRIKLEQAKLELEKATHDVADAKLKREGRVLDYKARSKALEDQTRTRKNKQGRCTHRKGGRGREGLIEGNSPEYAVLKHILPTQDVLVRCTRCGKTWYPPVKERFTHDGVFNESAFTLASQEYKQAVAFPTENQTSRSTTFTFRDANGNDITKTKTQLFTQGFEAAL